ncbi:flagellar hook assembly protein FlgD [Rhodanobacter ginsengisoli]|uniref:Basal-body rod modification protein FlgD n=1 Tax=Rhodanobacter ginsengisoli TaxID=418646 RepID=A0ABW0QJT5_9GAMM
MTTVNTNNAAANAASSPVGSTVSASLSQADFLKLMTAQLQAQDPTHPVDNTQFVSQMAQFSQLSSSQDLLTSVNGLNSTLSSSLQTSQVLGSANLVNREVLVPSSTLSYSGSTVTGAANVSSTGDVSVSILDSTGKVVRSMDLGTRNSGLSQFTWDGKDDSGNPVAQGAYTLAASSNGSSLDTYAAGKVTAVGYGGNDVGTYLQVAGVGGVPLTQVAQIL